LSFRVGNSDAKDFTRHKPDCGNSTLEKNQAFARLGAGSPGWRSLRWQFKNQPNYEQRHECEPGDKFATNEVAKHFEIPRFAVQAAAGAIQWHVSRNQVS
jgi:hypothetical protein